MAHFAKLDSNNVVIFVTVGRDEDTCLWEFPVAYPTDGKQYTWDEATTNRIETI